MLEDQVAYLLQRYLGNYIRGLNREALKISVWKGDVELTKMQLKPEALNSLKLPLKVKAGFLGSVKLKVPWSRLGQEPVLVYLEEIYILAEPATQVEGCSEDAIQEAKKARIKEMEAKLLESWQQQKSEMSASWLGSLISTIIGNLKLSISNVHIRYEDIESNPGHPFAAGVTLGRLSAVTVDDLGRETFATGGALEHIQKSVELESLAFYFDSDIHPWNVKKQWEDLIPQEWTEIFELEDKDAKTSKSCLEEHSYVLQPVTGNARYVKFQSNESTELEQPLQKLTVNLDDVTLSLSKDGYRDILELADNFSSFNQRLKYAHYRPLGPVKTDPGSWWKYAYRVVLDEVKKASGMLSWEQVLRYATLRKRYVTLYASLLKANTSQLIIDDNKEIDNLDRELDIDVIIQWRMLAHKFFEQSGESEALLNKQKAQKSWWSFGRNGSSKDANESRGFTEEDWKRLNEIIGYREDSDEQFSPNYDSNKLLSLFEIHMKHNASELFTDGRQCLASLSCDEMDFSIKMYTESKIFDFNLGTYRLLSPNGLLAESATAADSLVGVFSYKPLGAQLDWSFTAKASPCYITYLKDSIDEIISFFKSGTAISSTLAMETAVAVQMTLDGVRRTAQHQVDKALKDYSRFSLDLDIAAPKITIPTTFYPDSVNETHLLLDLGNLMLSTQDFWNLDSSEEKNKYMQFSIIVSDVSAFLVDGNYSWKQEDFSGFLLPVIDRCGIALKMEQIQVQSAVHPSTRLSMRLPSLGIHFSPARYHRLMQIIKMFSDEHTRSSDVVCPWKLADVEGWVSLLSWKGVGNREAIWQRRYLCLVGPFLYILESPTSRTYKHYFSLGGKQVSQVPTESTGNSHVLAVFDPMQSNVKVVEDANNLILRFDNEQSFKTWQNRLQGAIYRVSGSTGIASLADDSSPTEVNKSESSSGNLSNLLVEKFFVTGALDELKICVSCNDHFTESFNEILLGRETSLFEFRAVGGQVELSIRGNDLFIGTLLRSLEIEDQFRCEGSSVTRYLARSFIKSSKDNVNSTFSSVDSLKQRKAELSRYDSEEHFFEAAESLDDPADFFSPSQASGPVYDARGRSSLSITPPVFCRIGGLLPEANSQRQNMASVETDTLESFIKAQVIFYDQDSPFYNYIDKQVFVMLATLSFFCHRPTILAILEFANAISFVDDNEGIFDAPSTSEISKPEDVDTPVSNIAEEPHVRGLLGKGKSRVIFYLKLSMSTAQLFLTNEEGACLSTLLQNNLLTDIKVFPASFSIKAALGNLKISDDSLPSSHSYYWVCDMRNPGGSSFVELDFSSYNSADDDYRGYDYSLTGHLSEVRIVYLNRFVQEIVSYFVGLAPSGSNTVVKLRDQVSNSEVLLSTNEIEGSPSLRLELSLTKPIIIMPRRTDSPDYMEVDVLQVSVSNSFQWLCGDENHMNAVHLETLTVQISGINLTVGAQDTSGESIIKDVNGLSIIIRRSLRDLLHQIPVLDMAVKVAELRASLSNQEYQVITECFLSNISETPKIVPPLDFGFDYPSRGVDETRISFTSYPVSLETQESRISTTLKVSVSVDLIELQLYSGLTREISLATVQASGAWILYRSDSSGDSFLWSTLKGFTVTDEREGTKEEFRLAIGKNEDYSCLPHFCSNDNKQSFSDPVIKGGPQQNDLNCAPSMLIFDVKFRKSSTKIMLRIQRPRLLVALDFLLAITEFFAPTVRMIISDAVDNDLLYEYDAIFFDRPIYFQPFFEFSLSPKKPLIVDDERFDHYVYDGKGGNLSLKDNQGNDLHTNSTKAIIFVGNGKRLQFKNVYITNGEHLDSCVLLGSNSSYSASEVDNVIFRRGGKAPIVDSTDARLRSSETQTKEIGTKGTPRDTNDREFKMEYDIELQAIGPELTFYNTSSNVGESLLISNKLLRTELDMFCRLTVKGESTEIIGNILGTRVECNGIMVLEPFDTSIKFSNVDGREDILAFIRMTSKKLLVACSQFDKVGTIQCGGQTYAFWRPRAPPGFAVLGDCLTPLNEPPSKEVLAVNTNFVKVKRPISYTLIWPPTVSNSVNIEEDISRCNDASTSYSSKNSVLERDTDCSIWFPLAPQGYVSMGCVVSIGKKEPPLSSSLCIFASLVSPCSLQDCISLYAEPYALYMAFWRVNNSFGSFLTINPSTNSIYGKAYDLRHLSLKESKLSSVLPKLSDPSSISLKPDHSCQLKRHTPLSSGRKFEEVTTFKLIWSNQGLLHSKKVSIWRPLLPDGTVYFGDIAIAGYDPPNVYSVLRDCKGESVIKPPISFKLVGQVKKNKKIGDICLWLPLGPPGYVSLGCIASKSSPKYEGFSSLRCVRSDMVTADQFSEESIWDTVDTNITKEHFSIWSVGNNISTFVVRRGSKKPPKRFALKFVDPDLSNSGNTVIDAKVKVFSAAVYDDYGGLMVPLFNISLAGIGFTLKGRSDYMNSAVNFSLTGRSYNDKYEIWEPIVEKCDGFLRYQHDLNTPGASSELRITSASHLNINISSCNVNMLLQAYSSWNNLSVVHQTQRNREPFPALSGISILDAHNKSTCQIIPQNKLGQDIFIKATSMRGYSAIIKMPSGDKKPVKIPVSNNQSDSHFEGKSSNFCQLLLSVVLSRAELVAVEGLSTCLFGAVVNLFSNQPDESVLQKQTFRTCGGTAEPSKSSNFQRVIWDELCFFKVDLMEHYTLEIIVVDLGTGETLGSYSAPLLETAYKFNPNLESCNINPIYSWRELKAVKSKEREGDGVVETRSRIKCAVFLPLEPQVENLWKSSISSSKPGVIQISPTREGPWTTVKLNYAMPAACWRLGNNLVASELSVKNGVRYVNIRSLVSITNNTDFTFEMHLESKDCPEMLKMEDNGTEIKDKDIEGSIYDTDELFEIEKCIPSVGWISCTSSTSDPTRKIIHSEFQGTSCFQLPVGWESVDEWHIDKLSVTDSDGWVYAPDVEHLKWPESFSAAYKICARQRRWLRHRKYTLHEKRHLPLGLLKPGETVPLPLQTLVHPVISYHLQLKLNNVNETQQYSWSTCQMDHYNEKVSNGTQICVSALTEYEKLLCSCQLDGNSSSHANCLWFCLSSRAKEVGKDIYSNSIHDWKILVGSPLSVTNYLPLPAEYLLLHKHSNGQFVTFSQHIVAPGEMVKFYTVDSEEPLYISIAIQGWHMIHDPVIIYHPDKLLSQTVVLGSAISRRVVPIMLEQSHDKDHMAARRIRAYAPCWIESDRCPPLFYTFLDISNRNGSRWISFLSSSSKSKDEIIWEIGDKEMVNGRTMVSTISYKHFGLSLSIENADDKYILPAKDLSPLCDMDGSLDIYALDNNSKCIHIFVTSKPCPFLSVPTKVISIRPFMIFTNRIGQDIFLKFSDVDEPNVLSACDSRVSFIYGYARESELLVKLGDTDWSFPIKVFDEDIFTIMMKCNSGRRFLTVEIRGHEEGSRFHVIFRLGSSIGPFRIENRVSSKKIGIRQSCSDDNSWIQLDSFSTALFSWVNPHGPRSLDIYLDDEARSFIYNVNLEDKFPRYLDLGTQGILLDILEIGNTKVIRFIDIKRSSGEVPEDMLADYNGASSTNAEPLELVIELGDIGFSLIDNKPRELLYLYLKRVFISYSTGYDHNNTSRFKIIIGQLQLDNQLPLTLLPVILAPDHGTDSCHPAFKATITMCNESADGILVYPFVYVRVMDTIWRLNIHEPIIWSLMDFYGTLYLDRLTNGSEITQVDPEIRIDLIDVSEVKLKISLETAPTQRPVGVLGIWSPILSAIGNALKIQVHLKKVEHKNRRIRKSLILPSIVDRIKRDFIHDPLHLIFSVDVLGMTKSTFASLSKGFAELSTDGKFLQLRSKQVWSRRITGVSDGILQGTQALAQGVVFGVSGVVRKPIESVRQEGFSGFAHGLGRAVIGFIVQPVSGALDFVSLTVDGVGASVSKCVRILRNKGTIERIRKPRAIRVNGVLKDYCEEEAVGQMILYLAEASRHLGCTDLFKEPSKFAWSDYYEDHFLIPNHRILLVTNKRVMLLQCLAPDKMDKQPSKIIWDVPWEEVMALELAKAGGSRPSHLIIHLKKFRRSESFVRLVRCIPEEEQYDEPQAVRTCLAVRKMWKTHQAGMKTLTLKVPSSQRFVHFSWDESDGRDPSRMRPMIRRPRELGHAYSIAMDRKFTSHTMNFRKVWSSERDSRTHCTLCPKQVRDDGLIFSIWRPLCPDGYTSIGDSARLGTHPPTVAAIFRDSEGMFTSPVGYDLVWRNCPEDYMAPVSIWLPKAPEGFFSLGCIAVDGYEEPDPGSYCVSSEIVEDTLLENQALWNAPDSYPWSCYVYQVQSEALQFVALRHPKEESDWKSMRVSESKIQQLLDSSGSSHNVLVMPVGNPSIS